MAFLSRLDMANIRSGLDYTSLGALNPKDRALFATSARLLSCLVTESLVEARFYPHAAKPGAGFVVIQLTGKRETDNPPEILAILPLHHEPVLEESATSNGPRKVTLLDPLDMLPSILVLEPTDKGVQTSSTRLPEESEVEIITSIFERHEGKISSYSRIVPSLHPSPLWKKFSESIGIEKALRIDIESELLNSVEWQEYSFEHPPASPAFTDPSVAWEQSIVQGHPTHPMHKTRRFLPPIPNFKPGQFDLYHPTLRLISIPRNHLKITYNFEELLAPLVKAFENKCGKPIVVPENHVIVPMHQLQLYHIQDKFPEAHIFGEEFALPLQAQQSLRSVVVPDGYRNLHLKLATGMKLTSAVRTISPESAHLGPRFSAQVVPVLRMDPKIVTVARELASVVHTHPDGEIAKHCAALIREYHEGLVENCKERMIVCTSLVENGHDSLDGDVPPVIRIFKLDSEERRIQWLSKFLDVFFRAFLPSVIHNGVAFECHPQNCVARFNAETKELKGFIIRDFGGIRVHPPTLKDTTGVDLDFVEGHSIIAPDLDDVYTRMYHTVFHNHLQQLIRVLDLHYNGKGWALVRKHLKANIPASHPLYAAWLSPECTSLPGKCFMRMRLSGMYRHHLHGPFPNLIHYQGVDASQRHQGSKTKH